MPASPFSNSNKENVSPNAHPVSPCEIPVYNLHTDTFKLNPRKFYDDQSLSRYIASAPLVETEIAATPVTRPPALPNPIPLDPLPVSTQSVKAMQGLLNFSMFRASMRNLLEAAFAPSDNTKDLSNQDSASIASCGVSSSVND